MQGAQLHPKLREALALLIEQSEPPLKRVVCS